MANTALDGKPYAGNPHVRIDEGDGASAKPRRSSLLYKKTVLKSHAFVFAAMVCAFTAFADDPWLGITINGTPVRSNGHHYLLGDPRADEWEYGTSEEVSYDPYVERFAMNNRILLGTYSGDEAMPRTVREFVIDADEGTPNSKRPIEELDITITTSSYSAVIERVIIKGGYFGETFGMHRWDSNVTQRVDVKITGGTFLCTYDPFHVGFSWNGTWYDSDYLDSHQWKWRARDENDIKYYEADRPLATSTLTITGGSFAFDPSTVYMRGLVRDQMGKMIWEDFEDPKYPDYHFIAKTQQVPAIPDGYSARFDEQTGLWTVKSDVAWAEEDKKNEPPPEEEADPEQKDPEQKDPEVNPPPPPDGPTRPPEDETKPPELHEQQDDGVFAGNEGYNGWVRDENGEITGSLTLTTGKPGKKDGKAKIKGTYVSFSGQKQSIKTEAKTGEVATVTIPGVGEVSIGAKAVWSEDGQVQVAVNGAKSKDKAKKAAAALRLKGKAGLWTFALGTDSGYAAFSVKVDAKGKGKLTGTLPDGTKVSLSSQGTLGSQALAIPFMFAKKASFGCVFWVKDDGSVVLSDVTAVKTSGGTLKVSDSVSPSAVHRLADGPATLKFAGKEQAFTVAGRKWTFPRSQKKLGAADPNPCAVKLSFTEKTGVAKGSLTLVDSAEKKVKYTVNGVVVGDRFYGCASARGVSPIEVTAE